MVLKNPYTSAIQEEFVRTLGPLWGRAKIGSGANCSKKLFFVLGGGAIYFAGLCYTDQPHVFVLQRTITATIPGLLLIQRDEFITMPEQLPQRNDTPSHCREPYLMSSNESHSGITHLIISTNHA